MANKDRYNIKLLSISLASGLVLLALMTMLPTIVFAGTDYSNVIFGSKPVFKWIEEMEQQKATDLIPVTYENPYLGSSDAVFFGALTIDQAIHDINAAKIDTNDWISHLTMLEGGEFVDERFPLQQVSFDIEYGINAQTISLEK